MFNDECKKAKYKIGQYVRVVKGSKETLTKWVVSKRYINWNEIMGW